MQLAIERGFEPLDAIEFTMPGTDALLLLSKKGSLLEKFFKSIHSSYTPSIDTGTSCYRSKPS